MKLGMAPIMIDYALIGQQNKQRKMLHMHDFITATTTTTTVATSETTSATSTTTTSTVSGKSQ
jgi:hypothetical protein